MTLFGKYEPAIDPGDKEGRSYARLQLLSQVAGELLLHYDPNELLDYIFKRLSDFLGLEVYFHFRKLPGEDRMELSSYGGVTAETAAEIKYLPFGEAVCGLVALRQQPIVAEQIQESEDAPTSLVRSMGITAYACHPLIAQGRFVGTLSFGTRQTDRFDEEGIGLMRTICDLVAAAVDRYQVNEELRSARAELERANEMKDEFLSLVSHELRTPITVIYGVTRALMQRAPDDGDTPELLRDVNAESERLWRIVEDLLALGKLEKPDDSIVEPVAVRPLLMQMMEENRRRLGGRTVQLECEPDLPPVAASPTYLRQIASNLLSNAAKYSPAERPIEVRARAAGDEVEVSVRDYGPGAPEDELDRIFERFYRANGGDEPTRPGLGLGLTVCRRLVEALDGRIRASNAEGGGLEVTFALRVWRDEGA
jgi:signal transduction histidine kinase